MSDEFQPSEIDMIAAALRADAADVDLLVESLAAKLGTILPAGMLEVSSQRSMADRIAKRPGRTTSLLVTFPSRVLSFQINQRGGVDCQVNQVVRGVAISRRQATLAECLEALANEVAALAASSEAARAALARILQ